MITSTANTQVKQFRKLRERKERQNSGLFYAEGLRIVAEAAEQGAQIETIITAPELLVSEFGRQLVGQFNQNGLPVLEVSAEVFKSIALKEGPQGLAAVIRQRWDRLEEIDIRQPAIWVALESVADPGNLGTILRTNDAVGGAGVILLDQSTDPYDPSSVRASMGALFSQKLVRASQDQFVGWKRQQQVYVVGTSDKAQSDYQQVQYPEMVVLLMGSERQGLSVELLALCDEQAAIPMAGRSDSLNLAVATAVTLYEIYNQRRKRPAPVER